MARRRLGRIIRRLWKSADLHTTAKTVYNHIEDFEWLSVKVTHAKQEIVARENVKETLRLFAFAETLSHTDEVAYGAPLRQDAMRKENRIHLISINGVDYHAIPIKTRSTGLVGEILVPADPMANNQICINWTGTHDLGTVLADLESSPGSDSYRREESAILSQINEAVKTMHAVTGKPVDLMVTGHSLGGALAQQQFHTLQRAIATNIFDHDKSDPTVAKQFLESELQYRLAIGKNANGRLPARPRSHLNSNTVGSITLGAWNAAGVLKAVEDSSNQLAEMVAKAGVKQRAVYGMVGGDSVHHTGQGSVLSNVAPEHAQVNVLKVKGSNKYHRKLLFACGIGLSVGMMLSGVGTIPGVLGLVSGIVIALGPMAKATVDGHTAVHFQQQAENPIKCEFYQNNSPVGRFAIHKKLTDKSTFWKMVPGQLTFKGLHFAMGNLVSSERATHRIIRPEEANLSVKVR